MSAVYMAVTADEYELPIASSETARGLSRIIGLSQNRVSEALTRKIKMTLPDGEKIKFVKVEVCESMKYYLDKGAYMPDKAHEEDAGYDLYAMYGDVVPVCRGTTIDTGVHMAIPEGYCGILISKSGLNVKNGITSTGLIDCGYTGSIKVKLYNMGDEPYHVRAGDKISQLVIVPIWQGDLERVDELSELGESERGERGFGSSGR